MIGTIFILYLITDLGPAFKFPYERVVKAYDTMEACMAQKVSLPPPGEHMRLECRPETLYRDR